MIGWHVEQKRCNVKQRYVGFKNEVKILPLKKEIISDDDHVKNTLKWLQSLSKHFLKAQLTHMKHPRGCPETGECSAFRVMIVRNIEQELCLFIRWKHPKYTLRALLTCVSLNGQFLVINALKSMFCLIIFQQFERI